MKLVKKHVHELLCITVGLKMPSEHYRSVQIMKQFIQAPFLETTARS